VSVSVDPAVRSAVAAWVGSLVDRDLHPDRIDLRTPGGGGWSNETWLVADEPGASPLAVVRVQPDRLGMFPDYDLGRQAAVLAALGPIATVPTPPLLDRDLVGERLGRPAFVMGYVAGRAPSDDRPSFVEAGWLHDAAPADQRRFHVDLLDRIAAVHDVDVDAVGLSSLRPDGEPHRAALDRLRAVWDHDPGPERATLVEEAFAVVAATRPGERPGASVLLWGDARPANVLCPLDDVVITALLDWELADWGPPELDLAWLMEMNWMRTQGAGLDPLPGFLDDTAAVAHYAARTGRPMVDLGWYRLFSGLKVAVLLHRYLRAMVHAGRMPAVHRSFADNVATRRLAGLLDTGR
jgi:aminoglycoside phosphotransferase (APT) family kinase protein